MPDYDQLRLEELAAIGEFLAGLSDSQWDQPSLCEGWRVRDVISHMCVGYTTPMGTMVAKLRHKGLHARCNQIRLNTHVNQTRNAARGIIRVQRRENQMPGECGTDSNFRRFQIADFPHHDDIRVMAQ